MTDSVSIEVDENVLLITLNRPEKKNALTMEMYGAVEQALRRAEQESGIKVVVLTGAGDLFCAGNDIADFLSATADFKDSPVNRFLHRIASTDIPILAAVNGHAVGIGTTMLMHFEKVYAVETALFSTPFVSLGLVPEAASSLLMPKVLGYQRAARMLVLGESLSAAGAMACGLVSEVCLPDKLLETVMADAKKIAKLPKSAMRTAKRLMRRGEEPLDKRINFEMDEFAAALQSPEAQEAMLAFMEKRPVDFSQFD